MYTTTVRYTDYNGNEQAETLQFNLSETELLELNIEEDGGLLDRFQAILEAVGDPTKAKTEEERREMERKLVESGAQKKLIPVFKELLLRSYGVKSEDGKSFVKSEKLSEEFSQTAAFSALFMELLGDEKKMMAFVNGIAPQKTNIALASTSSNVAAMPITK